MSSEIKANSIQDKTGNRTLASDSGSAWSWGANVPKGSVIEQFSSPCDGSAITVQSGTYTVPNVTALQDLTSTFEDVTGSTIDYTPPTGTQTVIYTFNLMVSWASGSTHSIAHFRLMLDNDSGTPTVVTNFRSTAEAQTYLEVRQHLMWAFNIGGSDNDATGRRDTWTSARTIKLQAREYGSSNQGVLHMVIEWDGSGTYQFSQQIIGITALA